MTTKELTNGMVSLEAQDGFVLMRDGDATGGVRAALVPADTVGDWREVSIEDVDEAKAEAARTEAYAARVEELIRQKYSVGAELAILRQRDTKPDEFAEYDAYAEMCKAQAKAEIFGEKSSTEDTIL